MEQPVLLAEYAVRAGDVGDPRAAAVAAWHGNLGEDDIELGARYDALWASPHGTPVVRFVEHVASGVIVGVAALAPRRMRTECREVRAAVLSHLAIHREHRSLGPALMLLEALLAEARERFDLVYGIPNSSEGAGAALRRVGLRPARRLPRMVRVLRHAEYLERRLPRLLARPAAVAADALHALRDHARAMFAPRLRTRWVDTCQDGMDRLWQRSVPGPALASVRDAAMLRWRFDNAVGTRMRYLLVEGGSGTVAWFACDIDPKWPRVLNVHDYWSEDAERGIARPLLRALVRRVRADGLASLSLRAGVGDAAMAPWRAEGFVERGAQEVYTAWLDPALAAAPPPLHATYIDQDG